MTKGPHLWQVKGVQRSDQFLPRKLPLLLSPIVIRKIIFWGGQAVAKLDAFIEIMFC